ncbi:MAG TPA: hypothetical protein VNH18_26900, partial [Bryobacteraceae bacterium]|nr:hypothetical protein [Bryobacteraceae bacterium]
MPDTPPQPHAVYTERLAQRVATLSTLESRRRLLGWARLAAATLVGLSIWWAVELWISLWAISLPIVLFIALVYRHAQVDRATTRARRAIAFHERGLARLEHRWQGTGETGDRFLSPHHPYAADLDLFGRASLFELLSTARTRGGEARLAQWLKAPSSLDDLRARHQAIDELRPLLDLREQLAVLGEDFRTGVNPDHLVQWAATPAQPFPKARRATALALSIAAAVILVWWFATFFMGLESRLALIAIGLIEGVFSLPLRNRVLTIIHGLHEPSHDLDLLANILAVLESTTFKSPRLAALHATIRTHGEPASKKIARLRRCQELLDSRDNVFVRMFGPLLLWGTQTAMAVEQWRAENGPEIAAWLDTVAEFEALSALANYAWEHPADPFPTFTTGAVFEGEDMCHPLLAETKSVPNSVTLTDPSRLYVVSGSNMSGKSTLLRTTGVNAVLALAGAPVRARRLVISHLSLGASIRTMDSLEEGHSRFMAEILRLKQILDLPAPAFFLLDELLHGTNSHDRAIGAEGLVRA